MIDEDFVFFSLPDADQPYARFCQWYSSKFTDAKFPGITFTTAEQYMMLGKALLFRDKAAAAKILSVHSPAIIQMLGRKVIGWDRALWRQHCLDIVVRGNYLKFSQNPDMKAELLSTGHSRLVDVSPDDSIWGIGMGPEDALLRRDEWGMNLLGRALEKVRSMLLMDEMTDGMERVADSGANKIAVALPQNSSYLAARF